MARVKRSVNGKKHSRAVLKLLVTRLPLLPNKDLVFASATLAIVT